MNYVRNKFQVPAELSLNCGLDVSQSHSDPPKNFPYGAGNRKVDTQS